MFFYLAQKRELVELLIDCVIVDDAQVEIRYVIPTTEASTHTRFCHLRKDYFNEINRGKRGVTPETAWLFSQALGTTPQFWLNLQNAYDLTSNRPSRQAQPLVKAA